MLSRSSLRRQLGARRASREQAERRRRVHSVTSTIDPRGVSTIDEQAAEQRGSIEAAER